MLKFKDEVKTFYKTRYAFKGVWKFVCRRLVGEREQKLGIEL